MTRKEPLCPVEPGGSHPVIFLAQPPASESGRRMNQKRSDHIRQPRRRGHHNRQMGMLPPPQCPGSPLRKAGNSRRTTAPDAESSPGQTLTRPDAATSWAIVPADPARAAVRPKRSRLEAVGLPTRTPDRTHEGSRLKSESTRVGQRTDRVKTESGPTPCTCREEERVHVQRHGGASSSRGPSEPPRQLRSVRDGRTRKKDLPDQAAKITKLKRQPDRRFAVQIARSSSAEDCAACTPSKKRMWCRQVGTPDQTVRYLRSANPRARRMSSTHHSRPRRRRRSPQREPSEPSSSETRRGIRSSTTPARRASGSSSSCCSSGAAQPRRPRRGTVSRQDSVGPATLYTKRIIRRGTNRTRGNSSSSRRAIPFLSGNTRPSPELMLPRKKPPLRRPIVTPPRSKVTGSTAITTVDHRNKKPEKKDGRLRRLKNGLGLIFHHHHHHYHHHHPPSDADEYSGGGRPERRRHHRSLGELLRGMLHHTGGKRAAEGGRGRPPQQGQQHGYLHMLLEGLLRHLWRGPRRRNQRPPQPGGAAGRVAAKKLHWWQKLRRRRRGLRVAGRRRPRLRLGFGGKASVGRGGSKKKK